jgi:hypothetical protein
MTSYAPPRLSQEWGGAARNEPPAAAAFPDLPSLPEVARRLSAVQFVCVAACYVAKPPADGTAGQHAQAQPADVRVLAVGYCAGAPAAPELLKLSATPGFSLMRSWMRRVRCHSGQALSPVGADALPPRAAWLRAAHPARAPRACCASRAGGR